LFSGCSFFLFNYNNSKLAKEKSKSLLLVRCFLMYISHVSGMPYAFNDISIT
jgi:hypothetical protein